MSDFNDDFDAEGLDNGEETSDFVPNVELLPVVEINVAPLGTGDQVPLEVLAERGCMLLVMTKAGVVEMQPYLSDDDLAENNLGPTEFIENPTRYMMLHLTKEKAESLHAELGRFIAGEWPSDDVKRSGGEE